MKKQKYNPVYGSVRIFKGSDENLVYGHQFFNDDEKSPMREKSEPIDTFYRVNAIKYDNQIKELCHKASKKEISKSQLIEKLNEFFPKNVNKTRIN